LPLDPTKGTFEKVPLESSKPLERYIPLVKVLGGGAETRVTIKK
jgi:hypothetical protein